MEGKRGGHVPQQSAKVTHDTQHDRLAEREARRQRGG